MLETLLLIRFTKLNLHQLRDCMGSYLNNRALKSGETYSQRSLSKLSMKAENITNASESYDVKDQRK